MVSPAYLHITLILSMFGNFFSACLEVMLGFEQRNIPHSFIEGHTYFLACHEVLKWGRPPINRNRLLSLHIKKLCLTMHHKWKKIKLMSYAKQPTENPTGTNSSQKSSIELRDSSIVHKDMNDECRTNWGRRPYRNCWVSTHCHQYGDHFIDGYCHLAKPKQNEASHSRCFIQIACHQHLESLSKVEVGKGSHHTIPDPHLPIRVWFRVLGLRV